MPFTCGNTVSTAEQADTVALPDPLDGPDPLWSVVDLWSTAAQTRPKTYMLLRFCGPVTSLSAARAAA